MKLTRNQKIAVASYADTGRFNAPPEYQGQTVEVSYGCSPDYIYERRLDRSDRTLEIVAYQHPATTDEWEPWNRRPPLGRRVGVIYRGPASDEP
jgi:hypothetical protein